MKYSRRVLKCVFAYLLVAAMFVTSIQITPKRVYAETTTQRETNFNGNRFDVNFKVTDIRATEFQAEVTLINTSEKVIDNWAVKFALPYEITNIWNGVINAYDEKTYVIKNAESNQDIRVGESVCFGFEAKLNGDLTLPSMFEMLCYEEEVTSDKFEITFINTENWTEGCNGELKIKNISEITIEDWKLEFDCDFQITQFYEAEILEHEGNHYYIKNAGYNGNIHPDETITIGFSANIGKIMTQPENYKMSQIVDKKSKPDVIIIDETIDTDEDGLSDVKEQELGTDPEKPDTDGDGLTDYEEVKLGLNPKDIYTDGELDAEHKTEQEITGNQADINKIENNYKCTVNINGVGLASERLSVIPTMNVNLTDSDFILGNTIDINYIGSFDNATLSMKISEENIDNSGSLYAESTDELKGIKRFQIFKLDSINAGMYPIETRYDLDSNSISTDVDEFGTFCVVDLEKWLDSLGIAPNQPELEQEILTGKVFYTSMSAKNSDVSVIASDVTACTLSSKPNEVVITNPTYNLDIVYLVNNSQMVNVESTKKKLENLTKRLYNTNNYNVRVGVTTYCCYLCSSETGLITYKANQNIWATNATDAVKMINQMKQDSNPHQTHLDGLGAVMSTYDFRPNAKKVLVHVVNNGTEFTSNRYSIKNVADVANKMDQKEIKEVLIAGGRYVDDFKVLYNKTNGIYSSIVGPYVDDTYNYIQYLFGTLKAFRIINPISLRYINLDAYPSKGNYLCNSDSDGYSDSAEIDWENIKDDGGSLIFPTMREYLKVLNKKYGDLFKRLGESYSDRLDSILVLPVKCDPTLPDTDGDGINDDKDSEPLIYNCKKVTKGKNDLYVGIYQHCLVKYEPEFTEYYDLFSTTNKDTVIEVYTKNWLGKYQYLNADDNSGIGNDFKLTEYLERGKKYFIKLNFKSTGTSGTIDLNINTHTDKLMNSNGGSWVNVGKRTYANSFVLKTVYLPVDLVKELYDNVSVDKYKKYRALVVKAGITGAIAYLTGTASNAVLQKAASVGLKAETIKMSETGLNVTTAILTMNIAPDIWQMELDSIVDASNTFRNGVKISSMSVPRVSAFGSMSYEMINVYESWNGSVMEGEKGQLGKFTVKDYATLWR